MGFCEFIGTFIGGTLFCVGATVYYTCKLTGYLIFYAYLGTSWCIRKIYNYYHSNGTSSGLQQPSNTGYSAVRASTSSNNYVSVNVSPISNRAVSGHASASNNNATVSRNTTATTRNYLNDNEIYTSNRVVNGYVGRVAVNRNNISTIHASVTNSGSSQINNDDAVRATARDNKKSRDAAHVPVHKKQNRAKNNVKYNIDDETYGKGGPSSSNWRSRGRSNSRDRNKGQKEFRIPTSDVLMPTGLTVAVTIPSKPHCYCKQLSATKLIPLWPNSKMGSREYNIISNEMNNTIRHHNTRSYSGYNVVSVHKVKNCCLWTRFQNRQTDIGKETNSIVNQRMLFHGSAAADDIVRVGFDERRSNQNGMFGAGVYFAEHSSKSNQYAFGLGAKCPSHTMANCPYCVRKMLLCRVTLGTIYYLRTSAQLAHAPPGNHSVAGMPSASGLQYPEYIIYRGEQAYPEYLITYKIRL